MTSFISTEEQMFLDFLSSNGHPLDGHVNYDPSKFHYLPCPHGGKTDARYKFYSDSIASGYLKCWHCGIEDDFCSKQKKDVSPQEWKAHAARLKEAKQQEALETKKRHEEQAQLARAVFLSADEVTSNEQGYLSTKRVQSYGLRIINSENEHTKKANCYLGTVLVPCYNANNELVNFERIYLDATQNKYQKRPLVGAERSGTFYMLGTVTSETQTILVAEGYSSAATLYEAVGYPTVITFNCGNIPAVVKVLREAYLKAHILIVADDDCWQDDELIRFAGERAAKKHALKIIMCLMYCQTLVF